MSGNTVFVREASRPLALLATAIALMLGMCLAPLAERARATEATPELPNLVADPPTGVFLETSSTEGGLAKEGEAKLLLRFNGYVHNKGPGALDFRGRREAPKVSQKTIEEVERAKAKEEGLPQKTEEELAVPPMQVFQRLFTTADGLSSDEIRSLYEDPEGTLWIATFGGGLNAWRDGRTMQMNGTNDTIRLSTENGPVAVHTTGPTKKII